MSARHSRSVRTWFLQFLRIVLGTFLLVSTGQAGVTTYTYDVHGRVKTVTSPNGPDQTVVTLIFDNANNRTVLVTGLFDTTPPPVPINLSASAASWNQINLNWGGQFDTAGLHWFSPLSWGLIHRLAFKHFIQ